MKKFRGFSMVELLVSLIVVSLLAATFAPIITKKMKQANKSVTQGAIIKKKCEGLLDNHWQYAVATKIEGNGGGNYDTAEKKPFVDNSKYCKLCYREAAKDSSGKNLPYKCLKCSNTCPNGEFLDTETCNCIPCNALPNVSTVSMGYVSERLSRADYKGGYGPLAATCTAEKVTTCARGAHIWEQTYSYPIYGTNEKVKYPYQCMNTDIYRYSTYGVSTNTCPSGSYADADTSEYVNTVHGVKYNKKDYLSYFGPTECTTCPAGYYLPAGENSMPAAGAYLSCASSATAEQQQNHYIEDTGVTTDGCNGKWITPCIKCPAGQYQDERGKTSCKLCPAGTANKYTGSTGIGACVACAENTGKIPTSLTYQPKEGQAYCLDCGPSFASTVNYTKTECTCKDGYLQARAEGSAATASGDSKCRLCPSGHWCKNGIAQKCPSGTYAYAKGNDPATCIDCPVEYECKNGVKGSKCTGAKYSPLGVSECQVCPAGSYVENRTTDPKCTACPAGSYCPGNGSKYSCTAGNYCPFASVEQISCPAGNKCPNDSMSAPTPCTAGTYMSSKGQTYCLGCSGHQYCPFANTITPSICDINCTATSTSCTCSYASKTYVDNKLNNYATKSYVDSRTSGD